MDWAIDKNGVLNLNKWMMSFERKSLRVVVPFEHSKRPCYTKLVSDYEERNDDLDQIYKITMRDEDWVNLTADGCIAWDRESSYTSDSNEELEHWQNILQKISMLRCNMMTKSFAQCIIEGKKFVLL